MMPTELEGLQQASAKARNDYWGTVGKIDHVSHQLLASRFIPGRPLWPSLRETFLIIHRDDTTLIATDGLTIQTATSSKDAMGMASNCLWRRQPSTFLPLTEQPILPSSHRSPSISPPPEDKSCKIGKNINCCRWRIRRKGKASD